MVENTASVIHDYSEYIFVFKQISPSRTLLWYNIEFDFSQPNSESTGPDILANFELAVPPDIDQSFLLMVGGEDTIVSPSILDIGWRRENEQDLAIISYNNTPISLNIVDPTDVEEVLLTIELPPIEFYRVCRSVLNNAMNEKLEESIMDITGKDPHGSYIKFIEMAATATEFDDIISIASKFAEQDPDFRSWFQERRGDILVDMLLNKGVWRYQNLQSLDDLRASVTEINKYSNLPSTNVEAPIKFALRRIEQDDHFSPELMTDIIERLGLVVEKPDLIREHQFALSFAEQILSDEFRKAPELVKSFINKPDSGENAQMFFDEAKDEDDYEKKHEIYRSALRAADVDGTFRYAAANYLYWYAEKIEGSEEDYVVPTMFNAAAELFEDLGAEHFKTDAKYSYHFRSGLHLQHRNRHEVAADHFESAIEVAVDYPEDQRQRQVLNIWPYFYRTKARATRASDDFQSATEILSEGIEKVDGLDEEHPDIIASLKGQRFLYRAEQRMSENEYRTAAKVAGRAIEKFSEAEDSSSRNHAIRVRKKLDAYISEREGSFDEATNIHAELADHYGDKPIGWFHLIRETVCETKSLLLEGEFQEARQRLEQLRGELSGERLRDEPGELLDLIKVVEDYHQGDETRYTELDIFGNHSGGRESSSRDEDAQYALRYEYDYSEAIRTGLTAQRLKLSGIDTRMLDPIVEAAIEKAMIADSSLIEEHGLDEVPVSEGWQADLPEYVLIRIEDLRIDRDFTYGNFRGPLEDMTSTVEIALEPAVEYYGKQYWGEDWREEITLEDDREPDDDDNISIGHILQFFNSDAVECIDRGDEVQSLLNQSISDASNFAELRNLFDHGWITRLSEDEFKEILNHGLQILQICAKITPIIGKVESSNIEKTYSVRLQWGHVYRKVLMRGRDNAEKDTELDLSVGEYYYFPQKFGIGRSAVYPMDTDEVAQCSMNRVYDNLEEGSQ